MPATPAPDVGPFAHSVAGVARAHWEPLSLHLCQVGDTAARFAAAFGAQHAAALAGYLTKPFLAAALAASLAEST